MKKFFMDLLSSQSETSSKRFAALFTLFNVIAIAWVATIKDQEHVTPEFMFDSLALIAGGGLGLTVIEKIFTKKQEGKPKSNTTEESKPTE
jgi:hypothetical protein